MADLLQVQVFTGLQGPAGPTAAWRTGAGVPSGALGNDGDNYVNLQTGDWFQRASGAYGIIGNLKFLPPNGSSFITLPNGTAYFLGTTTGLYYQFSLGLSFGTLSFQLSQTGTSYAALVAAYTLPVPSNGPSFVHSAGGNLYLLGPVDGLYHQLTPSIGQGGVVAMSVNQIGTAFSALV